MKLLKINHIAIVLFIIINMPFRVFSQNVPEDSLHVTDLQEVVVNSERSWVENGVYVYLPTAKEKRLSNSPGTLIDVMSLPLLKGNKDKIVTLNGEPVSIAINGELANDIDLSTFWPRNVKKLEYLQNPSDPKYMGAKNVVNFIVAEYEAGGVTRVDVNQSIPLDGRYLIASKLNYKKMTYGIKFESRYKYDKDLKSEEITTYKDIYYNGIKYDELNRKAIGSDDFKQKDFDLAFNAKYSSDKITATHAFDVEWLRLPGSFTSGSNEWSEKIFNSDSYSYFSKSGSTVYSFTGDYTVEFTPKWILTAGWRYGLSKNTHGAWNQFGDNEKVENSVKETVNHGSAYFTMNYLFNPRWVVALSFIPKLYWFSSDYHGSVNSDQKQDRQELYAGMYVYWRPIQTLYFTLSPGLLNCRHKVGEILNNEIRPNVDFSGVWTPNRQFYLSATLRYIMYPVKSQEANDLLIKSSDLTWVEGNPYLKPSDMWVGNVSFSYRPCNIFSLGGNLHYYKWLNSSYKTYRPAPEDMGGVIETTMNAPSSDEVSMSLNMKLNLFDSKLSINAIPMFFHKKAGGEYARILNFFRFDGSISYIIGNFRFYVNYRGREKTIGNGGEYYGYQQDRVNAGVTYGWNNLYIDLSGDDLFHGKSVYRLERYSDVVERMEWSQGIGRKLNVNLTYTFGYGKKVDSNINVEVVKRKESSILSF